MGKKKAENRPIAQIVVNFFEDGRTEAYIENFERLSLNKIDSGFAVVSQEWRLKQQRAIFDRKKREKEEEDAKPKEEEKQDVA